MLWADSPDGIGPLYELHLPAALPLTRLRIYVQLFGGGQEHDGGEALNSGRDAAVFLALQYILLLCICSGRNRAGRGFGPPSPIATGR
jgi:hypothetical protein